MGRSFAALYYIKKRTNNHHKKELTLKYGGKPEMYIYLYNIENMESSISTVFTSPQGVFLGLLLRSVTIWTKCQAFATDV